MEKKNIVFIATSIDGYIAGKDGNLDWLDIVPNPEHIEMGFTTIMQRVDALVMGRNTFETVCSFEGAWPYHKPVYVLSTTLPSIPEQYKDKAELVTGTIPEILNHIHKKGHTCLYIDGGNTIQRFLQEDLIDELIITTIPILLGGGVLLFKEHDAPLAFELVSSTVYLDQIVQSHYKRAITTSSNL